MRLLTYSGSLLLYRTPLYEVAEDFWGGNTQLTSDRCKLICGI